MKLKIKEGTTSKLIRIFIQDSSATDGSGLTGLVFNSSGLSAYYYPEGDASATAITLATMTAGTWATGGFIEVDATNMPGVYEIGLPDAVIDNTSEGSTLVMLKGATNMAPVLLEIELDKVDYRSANWANFDASTGQILKATVDTVTNTHTPTTTEFQADDITEATADHYNGRLVIFTSGALDGQATTITDYVAVGGIGQFTVTTMTDAPSNDDTFIIV
jgi:hypothetical protein